MHLFKILGIWDGNIVGMCVIYKYEFSKFRQAAPAASKQAQKLAIARSHGHTHLTLRALRKFIQYSNPRPRHPRSRCLRHCPQIKIATHSWIILQTAAFRGVQATALVAVGRIARPEIFLEGRQRGVYHTLAVIYWKTSATNAGKSLWTTLPTGLTQV